jgi:hypothetical protein
VNFIPAWATNALKVLQTQQTPAPAVRTTGKVSTSRTAAPKAAAPAKIDNAALAQQYGLVAGFINAYPEIRTLFNQAVTEGWSSDKFQAKFKNTNWYKGMSESQRKAAIMQYSDPAEWSSLWTKTNAHVRDMMGSAGANPDDWSQVDKIASKMIWEGWNDEQAHDYIGSIIVFGPGGLAGGKAGEAQAELNQYSYAMGIKNSDSWIQSAVRQVASGKKSTQDFKNEILASAVATFPGFEKQLKSGATLADLAQPYTQTMSQILEIPQGQVNLFDPTIRNALSWKDQQGQAASKPLWQFQNELRTDPRWTKTQNAQDATMGTAHKVLADLGFAF